MSVRTFSVTGDRKPHQTGLSKLTWKSPGVCWSRAQQHPAGCYQDSLSASLNSASSSALRHLPCHVAGWPLALPPLHPVLQDSSREGAHSPQWFQQTPQIGAHWSCPLHPHHEPISSSHPIAGDHDVLSGQDHVTSPQLEGPPGLRVGRGVFL